MEQVKIFLDPGHGGRQPGCIGPTGLLEKNVNLVVVLNLAKVLTGCGHEVFLTRNDDTTISLMDRVKMARLELCDLCIHVHHNGAAMPDPQKPQFLMPDTKVNGTEVLIAERYGSRWQRVKRESRQCAEHVYDHLCKFGGLNGRGIRVRNDLVVLREATYPALLCEASFLSNPEQEARLRDEWYLAGEAQAIADGVCDYLRSLNPTPPPPA